MVNRAEARNAIDTCTTSQLLCSAGDRALRLGVEERRRDHQGERAPAPPRRCPASASARGSAAGPGRPGSPSAAADGELVGVAPRHPLHRGTAGEDGHDVEQRGQHEDAGPMPPPAAVRQVQGRSPGLRRLPRRRPRQDGSRWWWPSRGTRRRRPPPRGFLPPGPPSVRQPPPRPGVPPRVVHRPGRRRRRRAPRRRPPSRSRRARRGPGEGGVGGGARDEVQGGSVARRQQAGDHSGHRSSLVSWVSVAGDAVDGAGASSGGEQAVDLALQLRVPAAGQGPDLDHGTPAPGPVLDGAVAAGDQPDPHPAPRQEQADHQPEHGQHGRDQRERPGRVGADLERREARQPRRRSRCPSPSGRSTDPARLQDEHGRLPVVAAQLGPWRWCPARRPTAGCRRRGRCRPSRR